VLWPAVGVMAVIAAATPRWVMAQPSGGATQPAPPPFWSPPPGPAPGRRRNSRFKELEKLDPDAVCGQKMRLMRADELWAENLPHLRYLGLVLHKPPEDQPKAHHRPVPVDGMVDIGNSHTNVIERERRGHIMLVVSTGRRNTCIKSFCWGFNSQGFTWPFVEPTHRFV